MSSVSFPVVPSRHLSQEEINHVIALMSQEANSFDRCYAICEYFLGRLYEGGCLGEGEGADIDQMPLYRTDCFDCVTWVNMVLALMQSHDLASFEEAIRQVNYEEGETHYINRRHIMTTQWNPWNEYRGVLCNVTESLAEEIGCDVHYATARIDYGAWLRARSLADVRLQDPDSRDEALDRLHELHQAADAIDSELSELAFLPLKHACLNVLHASFPEIAVVEWVRSPWPIAHLIGTDLNVQHVGIAIRTDDDILFYHAAWNNSIQRLSWAEMMARCERIGVSGLHVQAVQL